MQTKRALTLLGVFAAVGFLMGCAEVPQQEVDMAKSDLEAARAAEAEAYASGEFQAASDSLNAAMAEIETQNGKFALFRSYDRASQLLKSASDGAKQAQQMAVDNKQKVIAEVNDLKTQTQTALQQANELLAKAPKGKESREALESIKNDLMSVESVITEADQMAANNQYLTARDRLKGGLDKTNQIIQELTDAIEKKKGLSRGGM
jgi:enamine deaminase RidA (YjgF/YER057c/UK114 family)